MRTDGCGIRCAAIAAAAMLAASPLPAEPADDLWFGPEYQTCAHLPTADLVECVGALTSDWERRLDEAYEELLVAQQTEEHRRLLQDAQAHWQGYRDASCRLIRMGEGSMAAVEAAACVRAMTEARARELGVGAQN